MVRGYVTGLVEEALRAQGEGTARSIVHWIATEKGSRRTPTSQEVAAILKRLRASGRALESAERTRVEVANIGLSYRLVDLPESFRKGFGAGGK